MIFAGDVAVALGDRFGFVGFPPAVLEAPWCFNLEGSIPRSGIHVPSWGLHNADNWFESFKGWSLGAVFLGNNHVHDVPDGVITTADALALRGISVFAAGSDEVAADESVEVSSAGCRYRLLGFGWPVIGCVPAGKQRPGVNRLEGRRVLVAVENTVRDDRASRLVVVIHGNYEFEPYPQPAHRRLALTLIDLGAYAVIFHHPHVVGPVERYQGRTIAYSLGNWAFSYGKFFSGRLRLPAESFHQIAVELGEDGDLVHHAQFVPPNRVVYERTEHITDADFSLKPIFEGYDDVEYLQWFKQNRIKRKGLPIYRVAEDSPANWLKDRWVGLRQVLINGAARSGLKALRGRG